MSSQNESILQNPKAVLVSSIIEKEKFNVGALIVDEILQHVRQEQTSLPFTLLIIQLCERVGVPFWTSTNVRITPASFSDDRWIEAECLIDDVARRKPPPPDLT